MFVIHTYILYKIIKIEIIRTIAVYTKNNMHNIIYPSWSKMGFQDKKIMCKWIHTKAHPWDFEKRLLAFAHTH